MNVSVCICDVRSCHMCLFVCVPVYVLRNSEGTSINLHIIHLSVALEDRLFQSNRYGGINRTPGMVFLHSHI